MISILKSSELSGELVVHLTYAHFPHDNPYQPLEDNKFTFAYVVDDLKSQIVLPRFYRFNVSVLKTLALAVPIQIRVSSLPSRCWCRSALNASV